LEANLKLKRGEKNFEPGGNRSHVNNERVTAFWEVTFSTKGFRKERILQKKNGTNAFGKIRQQTQLHRKCNRRKRKAGISSYSPSIRC